MFRWLRSGNPYIVLFLLIYALIIKSYFLLHPQLPVIMPHADGVAYSWLVHWLGQNVGLGKTGFTTLAFLLVVIQSLLLNSIINRYHIIPKFSFFPAFCFLLFSSFFASWNYFSSPLITNLLLLGLLQQLLSLYSSQQPRSKAFNLGLLVGVASMIYLPAFYLVVLVWISQLISRPFRLGELILTLLGLLCPYYFLATILLLIGQLEILTTLPIPGLSYPQLEDAYWILAGMGLLLWWFLYGSIRLQQDYMKMLIHIRKGWVILLTFICIGLILPFLTQTFSFGGWLIAFTPMVVFISIGFWHVRNRWFATLIHLTALAFIILIQWVY